MAKSRARATKGAEQTVLTQQKSKRAVMVELDLADFATVKTVADAEGRTVTGYLRFVAVMTARKQLADAGEVILQNVTRRDGAASQIRTETVQPSRRSKRGGK